MTIETKAAARYLEPCRATFVELIGNCLTRVKERRMDARVLMNRNRTVAAVIGSNQTKLSASFVFTKKFLFIAGRELPKFRHNPNLQKMASFALRWIEFAMRYAGAGTHPLHVTRAND